MCAVRTMLGEREGRWAGPCEGRQRDAVDAVNDGQDTVAAETQAPDNTRNMCCCGLRRCNTRTSVEGDPGLDLDDLLNVQVPGVQQRAVWPGADRVFAKEFLYEFKKVTARCPKWARCEQ